MTGISSTDLAYLAGRVRAFDHDRHLLTLFAGSPLRPLLLALYAFHVEMAEIPDKVREPALRQIRYQWWRERVQALQAEATSPDADPVGRGLAVAMAAPGWSPSVLDRYLQAQSDQADDVPCADPEAFERRVEAGAGSLAMLAAGLIAAPESRSGPADRMIEAAGHAGTAYGLLGLYRAIPFHAARERVLVPPELLPMPEKEGNAGPGATPWLPGFERLAERVQARLAAMRAVIAEGLPRSAGAALLPAALALRDLARLRRVHGDPGAAGLRQPDGLRVWTLLLRHGLWRLTGRL